MTEAEAMDCALTLALKGWGRVAPNPMVGAVLLRDGSVVAEGYHAEYGGPHAEVVALSSCPDPAGTTCVVTLEPCSHYGKTPPCVDALIRARVRRVVIAIHDPNPKSAGGAQRLRDAGVEVEIGTGRNAAAALNAPFLWSVRRPERPFLALKIATSADGFMAPAEERQHWISGPEARDYVHLLRAGFDAIGVGRLTAEIDDPQLTVRGAVIPRVAPRRVVFTRSGSLRRDLRLILSAAETPVMIVTGLAGEGAQEQVPVAGVQVITAEGLEASLVKLRTNGVRTLLVEGGPTLARALLEEGVVDRLHWIRSPDTLGSGKTPFGPGAPVRLDGTTTWTVTERRALGRDTLLVVDRELCLPAS